MSEREYDGTPIDATGQHITESPVWGDDGETVAAVDDEPEGQETTENVPHADDGDRQATRPDRPDVDGQSRLDQWGSSS